MAIIVLVNCIETHANFNQPLDRAYTLKNSTPFILENEYHRLIKSEKPRSFIFPRSCISPLDYSQVCREKAGLRYRNKKQKALLNFRPIVGYELREIEDWTNAFDGGLNVSGFKGPASFYLDARIFTEIVPEFQKSYDREFVEKQEEKDSDFIKYASYARYRSNLSYDFEWARLTAAHDAAHWGPGLFTNLMFHQDAVPFNYVTLTTWIGPISVITLYGEPHYKKSRHRGDDTTRTLYAHRYEISFMQNLLFGISEQLIFFNANEPFALAPIVPLFMQKGLKGEKYNNGNLAFDISYRFPGLLHLYSEFLIDDLQAPTALFNDFWANKWAWMAGMHWIKSIGQYHTGAILEYCRIEPWVYTHYYQNTAQAGNGGYPLGNQMGPNSQSYKGKLYIRQNKKWYVGCRWDVDWKGKDLGSRLHDEVTKEAEKSKKHFIRGISRPQVTITPYATYTWKWVNFWSQFQLGDEKTMVLRVQFLY